MKLNKRPQSSVIGAAGEHLVLSHLLRLGFIAGKTPDFTKDYDLVVINKDGTHSAPIQVKTSTYPNWLMQKKHEEPIDNLFYCFVRMSLDSIKTDIFIMDSNTVSNFVKTSHKIWLKMPARNGKKHKDTNMRKIESNFNHFKWIENPGKYLNSNELKFIEDHSKGWMEKYREAWHLIKT